MKQNGITRSTYLQLAVDQLLHCKSFPRCYDTICFCTGGKTKGDTTPKDTYVETREDVLFKDFNMRKSPAK